MNDEKLDRILRYWGAAPGDVSVLAQRIITHTAGLQQRLREENFMDLLSRLLGLHLKPAHMFAPAGSFAALALAGFLIAAPAPEPVSDLGETMLLDPAFYMDVNADYELLEDAS